jgi:hypothetical protein
MELQDALFANAAEVSPDGRASVLGGGIEGVFIPTGAKVVPALSLVVRIRFTPADYGQIYRFQLKVTRPNGEDAGLSIETEVRVQRPPFYAERGTVNSIVVNLYGLIISGDGLYKFDILMNEQKIGATDLALVPEPLSQPGE